MKIDVAGRHGNPEDMHGNGNGDERPSPSRNLSGVLVREVSEEEPSTPPTLDAVARKLDAVNATALIAAREAALAREEARATGFDLKAVALTLRTVSDRVLTIHQAVTLPMWKRVVIQLAGAMVGGALVEGVYRILHR